LASALAVVLLGVGQVPAGARAMRAAAGGREVPWRPSFLVEYYSDTAFPRIATVGYRAVRTGRHKLIRYRELEGMDELYDLDSDPFALRNRIGDERLGQILRELDAQLLSPAPQPTAR
jgi:hypothetical protein